jgi:ketosteroid isomerase-like protein
MSGYPTREYILAVFKNFEDPPKGTEKFFDYVDDNVHWQVTGQQRYAGTWTNKKDYYDATWGKINRLLADPGYKLEVPGGIDGVILGHDGWSVVEMKTVDTKTKSGVPYTQHYSWHVRWSKEGKIVQAKAFLDTDHLENVLGGEQRKQEAAAASA